MASKYLVTAFDSIWDTETQESFTVDSDMPQAQAYRDWLEAGNQPDIATPPQPADSGTPENITVGEHVDDDEKVRLAYDLRSYYDNPSPTPEFTIATLKQLIRLVLN